MICFQAFSVSILFGIMLSNTNSLETANVSIRLVSKKVYGNFKTKKFLNSCALIQQTVNSVLKNYKLFSIFQ